MAHREDFVSLSCFVVTDVLGTDVGGRLSVGIDGDDVTGDVLQLSGAVVPDGEVECVVLLVQARTHPVEVHELAVLVLVEVEVVRQFHVTETVVQVDACVHLGLVESQSVAVVVEDDIDEVFAFGNVETLELAGLQVECGGLRLHIAIFVEVADGVFQYIVLAHGLAPLVELEDVEVVVIPVLDEVAEAVVTLGLVGAVHLDFVRIFLQGEVDEEVVTCRQEQ